MSTFGRILAGVALCCLTMCGCTDSHRSAVPSTPHAPPTGEAHSAAEASARADALLYSVQLPKDARWSSVPNPGAGGGDPSLSDVAIGQVIHFELTFRNAVLPKALSLASAAAFFHAHPPAGWRAEGGVDRQMSYVPVMAALDDDNMLWLTLTPTAHGVALATTAEIGWSLSRTSDENLPASADSLTLDLPAGGNPVFAQFGHRLEHVTGPDVRALVHYLNALSTQRPSLALGGVACTAPLFLGGYPSMSFQTPSDRVVLTYSESDPGACSKTFHVSVNGQSRPTLAAGYGDDTLRQYGGVTALVMTRMLGIKPNLSAP